ncbi:DUF3768 domain-containing protein [Paracoccus sp. (in: a-proteobacteria)]|uniref:DUF3768 domain-containing protein n=1 Tax=Paracoccus sp. TaxID=267 RepID=UPI00289D34EC|nr:DUF3768 domain-containing protein [Paracoccus sp. (in: a-proteobacteria)]
MPDLMTMTPDAVAAHIVTLNIAEQNDAFRKALGLGATWRGKLLEGRAVTTTGFRDLPPKTQDAAVLALIGFDDFTEENDPYGDHSFGVIETHGAKVFWKVDIYDSDYSFGASLPKAVNDPSQCRRVLTLYLPSEH